MSPRRSAFLDIGTNTVLCLIAEIRDTGRFRVLDDLVEITRLGEGVDQKRRISPAGEERTLAALRSYRARCDSLGVTEFLAVGTSALRDAENSADVLNMAIPLPRRMSFVFRLRQKKFYPARNRCPTQLNWRRGGKD